MFCAAWISQISRRISKLGAVVCRVIQEASSSSDHSWPCQDRDDTDIHVTNCQDRDDTDIHDVTLTADSKDSVNN